MASHPTCVVFLCFVFLNVIYGQIYDTTIVMQNQYGKCQSIWDPRNRTLQDRDTYYVISQTVELISYQSDRNCVVSIVGKPGYQWNIRITRFDIEGEMDGEGHPVRCPDFVKMYDSERCDNAKLLKGINYMTGLCGIFSQSQIGASLFSTCANYLTIQFKADIFNAGNAGFSMELIQSPWQNPTGGPDCDHDLNGIAPGVWRDGTFNEFQNTWNEQPVIPGYVPGGNKNDYNTETNGISCYECSSCPVEPFDPDRDLTALVGNCYTCSKEWDEEYQSARRKCYARSEYTNLILSFQGIDSPFFGCRQIVNDFGRTVNYCFCQENNCNTGSTLYSSISVLVLMFCLIIMNKLTN